MTKYERLFYDSLSLALWALAGGSTTGVLHALDIVGRLLGLSKRHFLLAALGVLATEQSNDRGIELVSSVQELELHEEEVSHDVTTNLLDKVSSSHCGATCDCVSLRTWQDV
jgi:hypothetical protein